MEWKGIQGETDRKKTESDRLDRHQSPVPVLALAQSYLICRFIFPPDNFTHCLCSHAGRGSSPLAESHSIYLSPPYLSSKTIQAWTRRRRREEEEEKGAWLRKGNFITRQKCTCHSSEMWTKTGELNFQSHPSFKTQLCFCGSTDNWLTQ